MMRRANSSPERADGGGLILKQSRRMSLVEAVANVVVGYGVAVVAQILIFPVFGLHATLAQNLKIGAVFSIVSITRSFALRRLFEAIRYASRCSKAAPTTGASFSIAWAQFAGTSTTSPASCTKVQASVASSVLRRNRSITRRVDGVLVG